MERSNKITDLLSLAWKVGYLYTRRICAAPAVIPRPRPRGGGEAGPGRSAEQPVAAWAAYGIDWVQRWVLFWDTLRQRGNNFVEHERAGKPPLLVFDYELVVDGRKLPGRSTTH
ncbi:MAG: DUF3141 domain-containing protein [Gemmataceae bacterium]